MGQRLYQRNIVDNYSNIREGLTIDPKVRENIQIFETRILNTEFTNRCLKYF